MKLLALLLSNIAKQEVILVKGKVNTALLIQLIKVFLLQGGR